MTYRKLVIALAASCAAAFCAKAFPPPGGTQDKRAPQVISTTPARLAIDSTFRGDVTFQFDERISERGADDLSVIVSPETGRVRVSHGRSSLRVSMEGGWQPNQIYRIVLLPTIRDLFGNQRKEPYDLVFSTGPVIPGTSIAGLLQSRITNKPTTDARVEAVRTTDSVVYTTVSDSAGFYALRYVPMGTYTLHAYVDQNRNKKAELEESRADTTVALTTPRDTLLVMLTLQPGDTTPARLLRAEVRDSMSIRLTLDDYVDVSRRLTGVQARLFRMPDSVDVPVRMVVPPRVADSMRTAATAKQDTTRRAAPAGPRAGAPADTVILPVQELIAVTASPLVPRTRYRIFLAGVVNLAGLPNGGGSVVFTTPDPPRAAPAPAARDTTRGTPVPAAPDTTRRQR